MERRFLMSTVLGVDFLSATIALAATDYWGYEREVKSYSVGQKGITFYGSDEGTYKSPDPISYKIAGQIAYDWIKKHAEEFT